MRPVAERSRSHVINHINAKKGAFGMIRKFIARQSRHFTPVLAVSALIVILSSALCPSGSLRAAEKRSLSGEVSGGLSGGEYSVKTVLTVPAGDTLSIGAGAVLYFEQLTGIDVRGVLSVSGALGLPVVMTSCGDTAGAAQAFDWNGVMTFGPDAAVFMRYAVIGNSVYGVNIGDTLSSVDLRDVTFKNNGYAPLVRGGEMVPVAADAPVNVAWNITDAPPPPTVKTAKSPRKVGAKFIVNVSALGVAAAGMTACYIGLSNTSVYYKHYVPEGNDGKLSEYYEDKIRKNMTVSALGAIAAGVGLSCIGVTLFF